MLLTLFAPGASIKITFKFALRVDRDRSRGKGSAEKHKLTFPIRFQIHDESPQRLCGALLTFNQPINSAAVCSSQVDVIIYVGASNNLFTTACAAPLVFALCSVFWRRRLPKFLFGAVGTMDFTGKLNPASHYNQLGYLEVALCSRLFFNLFLQSLHHFFFNLLHSCVEQGPIASSLLKRRNGSPGIHI